MLMIDGSAARGSCPTAISIGSIGCRAHHSGAVHTTRLRRATSQAITKVVQDRGRALRTDGTGEIEPSRNVRNICRVCPQQLALQKRKSLGEEWPPQFRSRV